MLRRVGMRVLVFLVIVAFCGLGFMAFARRDHKIQLAIAYQQSPPSAVWRLLTDHAEEPRWLPAFGTVVRQPDIAGHEVWTHISRDRTFSATVMTVAAIPEQRYERLLLRDGQRRDESWDGRWVYELRPNGSGGTLLRITEYGWTDGFTFFIAQRVLSDPDAFLRYYASMIGQELKDPPEIQVLRPH